MRQELFPNTFRQDLGALESLVVSMEFAATKALTANQK
jgi:hypothetical protein